MSLDPTLAAALYKLGSFAIKELIDLAVDTLEGRDDNDVNSDDAQAVKKVTAKVADNGSE
jgi:hypothetical protein